MSLQMKLWIDTVGWIEGFCWNSDGYDIRDKLISAIEKYEMEKGPMQEENTRKYSMESEIATKNPKCEEPNPPGRAKVEGEAICEHEWVSAVNEVVKSGEMCIHCHAVRPTEASGSEDNS